MDQRSLDQFKVPRARPLGKKNLMNNLMAHPRHYFTTLNKQQNDHTLIKFFKICLIY